VLSLAAADAQIDAGATTTVLETFADEGTVSVKRLSLSLDVPRGWRVRRLGRARRSRLAPGRQFTVSYSVTAPGSGPPLGLATLAGTASYDPVAGLDASLADLGESVSVPVPAPFATANTTGQAASYGVSDGSVAISASGLGVLPAFNGQPPVDSYAAIYEPGAGLSSTAQVTVTSDPAGGNAGAAGLIQRDQMTAPAGSGPAVALFVNSNNTIEMAWNASGGPDVDTWLVVPSAYGPPPVTLQLVRSGSTYTGYFSTDHGVTWRPVDTVTVAPSVSAGAQDVGIFHASGLDTWQTTASFEDLLVNGAELR
jgi:hypothetical protein